MELIFATIGDAPTGKANALEVLRKIFNLPKFLFFSLPHHYGPDQAGAAEQSVACLPERVVAGLERG